MSEFAERVYANNVRNKKNKTEETQAEKNYRLSRIYSHISSSINTVSNASEFLKIRNEINSYAGEAGKEDTSVLRLTNELNSRADRLLAELEEEIRKTNQEMDELRNDRFQESPDQLQALNSQAETRTLQFLLQLGANNDGGLGNRRRIGNWIKEADRANALALLRIASLPQFTHCFSSKQKEIIIEKSKNPAETIWEENKQPILKEKGAQLGKLYMRAFTLKKAMRKIGNSENSYYFGKNGKR